MAQVTVQIAIDTLRSLDALAAQEGLSREACAANVLVSKLATKGGKQPSKSPAAEGGKSVEG